MFTATFGFLLLILSLSAAIYSLFLNIVGVRGNKESSLEKARLGMAVTTSLITLASLVLFSALATDDFSLKYVYDYSTVDLPLAYKLSAFWAGNAGSLLLWALILAVLGAVIAFSHSIADREMTGIVSGVVLVNIIFFLVSMILFANPFDRMLAPVGEGRGLNPMLRNPWMVIHPVTLYLGYVGWVIPFAFAMGGLLLKREGADWIRLSRRWAVLSWLFLSLGNLFGAQWAYIELGWGGYWAWDPVENASFLPWLTGTAFLHSVMIQERKGMFKFWNIALVIITYWLTLYGTFLVRSGVLSSVHAFPKSNLSYWFGFFMFAMLLWALYLLASRRDLLKSENIMEAFFSRETGFFLNNILLMCSGAIIFLGTNLPIFTGLLTGVKRAVGEDWFNRSAGPVLLAVILLMGICPLLPWNRPDLRRLIRQALLPAAAAAVSGVVLYLKGVTHPWALIGFSVVAFVLFTTLRELFRGIRQGRKMGNYRRWGAYLVHLGVVLFALGAVGDAFYSVETVKTMRAGETFTIGKINDYKITFQGVRGREEGVNGIIYSDLLVEKNGRPAVTVTPEKIYYPNWESPRTEIAILGGPVEDLYIVLAGWGEQGKEGTFEIHINPLMNWLWIGGYVLMLGSILVLWPGKGLLGKGLRE